MALDADVTLAAQRGRSFGERFRTAMRSGFERAAGPLLVVGSDAPGLTGDHLTRALERLGDDPRRVVVGPSPDGGFYLLASHRPLDDELARVRWCTPAALDTLLAALRASGLSVSLLEPLRDLDRASDLVAWLAGEATRSARWRRYAIRLLRALVRAARPPAPAVLGRSFDGHGLAFAGRSPPL